MVAKKRRRKSAPKRKKTAKSRGGQIPLKVLKKRLASLRRLVDRRQGESQTSMW